MEEIGVQQGMEWASKLKQKGFLVKEFDDYLLVHPSKGKWEWEPDELHFRSVILSRDGNVVSTGWPKFFNQGEFPEHDTVVANELESGRAIITHKHDGSLLIRSVLPGGRILFRTRDSFDGGKFAPLAEAVANAHYPRLLDPNFFPHGSLLFEYVGEENQIVVRYRGDDDLIFLGAAEHGPVGRVRYLPFAELESVARDAGLRLVETYGWASAGIGSVLDMVRDWDTAEGVVVRSSDGQTLLKIKSAWYFAQHSLRWHMTYEAICRFAIDGNIEDEEQLASALGQAGWDYETTLTARDHFRKYLMAREHAEQVKQTVRAFYEAFDQETAGQFDDERARRKAFAMRLLGKEANLEMRPLSGYCFYAYDSKWAHLDAILLRRIVLRGNRTED
ncbi:MAG: hypothetical protein OHK0029_39300 [Armatimonadaceae bacterium]